jgi:iron complex outermembrane receptor protein
LLAGSGLAIATTDDNAVITKQTGEITLDPVKVGDTKKAAEGSAEVGYRVDTLHSVGPLGAMNVLDTPYSMTVIPHQLIENVQAPSPDPIIQMNPFSQLNTPTTRGYNVTETIRGFSAMQLFDSSRESLVAYEDLEDKDRVEILNGLSGFLNGNAAASTVLPGGTINYILKRPTDTQFTDLTVGEYYNYDPYTHVDVGGPVGEKFGYRLNAVGQSGDTAVDRQSLTRYLISGAFDFHLADNFLLQLDLSNSYRKLNGIDAYWGTASSSVPFPSAPNAAKNFGQPWTFWETSMLHTGTNMTWEVNNALTLRSSFRFAQRDSKDLYENNTLQSNGTFSEAIGFSYL